MQRMIRSDTAHSAHIHGYQHITIYVHSSFANNASLSILSVQPCMHPHTTPSPLSVQYTLYHAATYITTYNTKDRLWFKSVHVGIASNFGLSLHACMHACNERPKLLAMQL